MIRSVGVALIALSFCMIVHARPAPPPATSEPVKVKVVSLPPPSQTEVKVVSLPANSAPVDVRVVSSSKDDGGAKLATSTDGLTLVTWLLAILTGGVFVFTAVLARTTSQVVRAQSDELARRDKDALAREVHRAAHRLRLDAERTRLLMAKRTARQASVRAMIGNGGGQTLREVLEKARDKEVAQLNEISASTDDIAGPGVDAFGVLGRLSAAELARRQWTLDGAQALVDVMRDTTEKEIAETEADRVRYLNEAAQSRAVG